MLDKIFGKNQKEEQQAKEKQQAKEIFDLARKLTAELHAERHRPAVRFSLELGEPGIFESKAGGTPYLPRDMAWPLDGDGVGMGLLAQIDCTGLAGLPDFPQTGLLQFFTAQDEAFGADFDAPLTQKGFRVFYHETVDRSVTAEEVVAKRPPLHEDEVPEFLTPLCQGPCRIVLKAPSEQGMNENDPRFEPMFTERWNRTRPDLPIKRVWDLYSQAPVRLRDYSATEQPGWEAPFHQLGGYPYFTQQDPRPGKYDDLDVLLFQLDSDFSGKKDLVLWGDSGVANFFISQEALKRRDFSRVLYNWDCC